MATRVFLILILFSPQAFAESRGALRGSNTTTTDAGATGAGAAVAGAIANGAADPTLSGPPVSAGRNASAAELNKTMDDIEAGRAPAKELPYIEAGSGRDYFERNGKKIYTDTLKPGEVPPPAEPTRASAVDLPRRADTAGLEALPTAAYVGENAGSLSNSTSSFSRNEESESTSTTTTTSSSTTVTTRDTTEAAAAAPPANPIPRTLDDLNLDRWIKKPAPLAAAPVATAAPARAALATSAPQTLSTPAARASVAPRAVAVASPAPAPVKPIEKVATPVASAARAQIAKTTPLDPISPQPSSSPTSVAPSSAEAATPAPVQVATADFDPSFFEGQRAVARGEGSSAGPLKVATLPAAVKVAPASERGRVPTLEKQWADATAQSAVVQYAAAAMAQQAPTATEAAPDAVATPAEAAQVSPSPNAVSPVLVLQPKAAVSRSPAAALDPELAGSGEGAARMVPAFWAWIAGAWSGLSTVLALIFAVLYFRKRI